VIFNFLERLGFYVELANLGDGFGFLIAESGRGYVETAARYSGEKSSRNLRSILTKTYVAAVGAGLGGHAALAGHGMIGAEDEGHGVHEEDAAAGVGSWLGCEGRRGRGCHDF